MVKLRLDRELLLNHITDEDQILNMRKLLDKLEIVLNKHTIETTNFMDPYQRRLARSILNRFLDISYRELGGINKAERKVIQVYPEYLAHEDIELPIGFLEIEGGIRTLSHRDFLGGILNLGINREKIGDILIHEDNVQLVVKREVLSYILMNLTQIGRQRVEVKEISIDELKPGIIEYEKIFTTVPSLRIDVLISSVWNLPRKESQGLVKSKGVKVNWEPVERVSKEIIEGDIVSVKGYGRFMLNSTLGMSKKGRVRIELRLLK
ncbi:YlmH family RNA-binding protein [Tepidimicrobium xylanilyticum]|uniref:YlmH family RNA-binding protein n=1 Tax=Tepidimicrobium xylanilyticum TaxID=1123352 RepID=UPI000B828FE1|nr:YlmH/Sll1252 family protein [Tepidimicrobium xylanilyticum]